MKKVISLFLLLTLLLISSADIQAIKECNWIRIEAASPLYEAIDENDLDAIEALLQAGADPNLGAYPGQAPLNEAMTSEVVDKLVAAGAKVNRPKEEALHGRQPLHEVTLLSRSKDAVEALLRHGADVNATDNDQRTPLHLAAWVLDGEKGLGVIEALVDSGAHINAQDKYGATPLDILFWEIKRNKGRLPQDENLKAAVNWLKAKGAKTNAFRPGEASSWFSRWFGSKTEL